MATLSLVYKKTLQNLTYAFLSEKSFLNAEDQVSKRPILIQTTNIDQMMFHKILISNHVFSLNKQAKK